LSLARVRSSSASGHMGLSKTLVYAPKIPSGPGLGCLPSGTREGFTPLPGLPGSGPRGRSLGSCELPEGVRAGGEPGDRRIRVDRASGKREGPGDNPRAPERGSSPVGAQGGLLRMNCSMAWRPPSFKAARPSRVIRYPTSLMPSMSYSKTSTRPRETRQGYPTSGDPSRICRE
jgi:hypothetical protein